MHDVRVDRDKVLSVDELDVVFHRLVSTSEIVLSSKNKKRYKADDPVMF